MSQWSVYEVDVAHKLEPAELRLVQHTRARAPDEAVERVLGLQGDDAMHFESDRGSPRLRRACDAIETAQEEARLKAEADAKAATEAGGED